MSNSFIEEKSTNLLTSKTSQTIAGASVIAIGGTQLALALLKKWFPDLPWDDPAVQAFVAGVLAVVGGALTAALGRLVAWLRGKL